MNLATVCLTDCQQSCEGLGRQRISEQWHFVPNVRQGHDSITSCLSSTATRSSTVEYQLVTGKQSVAAWTRTWGRHHTIANQPSAPRRLRQVSLLASRRLGGYRFSRSCNTDGSDLVARMLLTAKLDFEAWLTIRWNAFEFEPWISDTVSTCCLPTTCCLPKQPRWQPRIKQHEPTTKPHCFLFAVDLLAFKLEMHDREVERHEAIGFGALTRFSARLCRPI